jgi:acetyltransferase-like isoleucine patch superfamily enzyme
LDNYREGQVSRGVFVATSFFGDYGYNLCIKDDVMISADAHLHDSGVIVSSEGMWISGSGMIQTLRTPVTPTSVKGRKGEEGAKAVRIGGNVFIGDGCTKGAG